MGTHPYGVQLHLRRVQNVLPADLEECAADVHGAVRLVVALHARDLRRLGRWILWGHTLRDSMKAKGLPPHLYKSGGRWRRDNAIEEIKRLDALLEYAVQHNDTADASSAHQHVQDS